MLVVGVGGVDMTISTTARSRGCMGSPWWMDGWTTSPPTKATNSLNERGEAEARGFPSNQQHLGAWPEWLALLRTPGMFLDPVQRV